MKIFKRVVISIMVLIGLLLIIGALLPRDYTVTRTIEINSSPDSVYNNVADFRVYKTWNWWAKQDPLASFEIKGEAKQPGSSYSWNGNEIGIGSLTLETAEPGKKVKNILTFKKPFETIASDNWEFEASQTGTKVIWVNSGKLPYPMGAFIAMSMNTMLGPQMDSGLVSLKALTELK